MLDQGARAEGASGTGWRSIVSTALLAFGAALPLAALVALCVQRDAVDSLGFAERATAELDHPTIRAALADEIVDQILPHGWAECVSVPMWGLVPPRLRLNRTLTCRT